MLTVAQLCDQMRALTHDDLIDGVHTQIADAIQAVPKNSTVIERRLVEAHKWVEGADVSVHDAQRAAHSAQVNLSRAIKILKGLHAK